MIGTIIDCKDDFKNEAIYTFRTFYEILGIKNLIINTEDIGRHEFSLVVYYGSKNISFNQKFNVIHIESLNFIELSIQATDNEWIMINKCNSNSDPSSVFFTSSGTHYGDILYKNTKNERPLISKKNQIVYSTWDIISNSFFFLSRQELIFNRKRDIHGRFLKQFSKKPELYDNALVDKYIGIFSDLIEVASSSPLHETHSFPLWKDGHTCSLLLSHDVDRIRNFTICKIMRYLRNNLHQQNGLSFIRSTFNLLINLLNYSNWFGNFSYISKLENKYDVKSTFFVSSYPDSKNDPSYNLQNNLLKKQLRNLLCKGWDIELHGSYNSAKNIINLQNSLKSANRILEKNTKGMRFHYLRFLEDITPRLLDESKIQWDSTVGFCDSPGYAAGISYPFAMYDLKRRIRLNVFELPLVIMDTYLLLEKQMDLNPENAWEIIKKFLDKTLERKSCITINWHQSIINKLDLTGYSKLYNRILAWGKENNAWITSPNKLISWWSKRIDFNESNIS